MTAIRVYDGELQDYSMPVHCACETNTHTWSTNDYKLNKIISSKS